MSADERPADENRPTEAWSRLGNTQEGRLRPGSVLGRYEIQRLLGAGGMGQVYLARDTRLKRPVALKVLSDEVADNPQLIQRWQREAETVAALNHPNIVTLFSVEKQDEIPFFTMELIEGDTLAGILSRGGLPLERFFDISIPLADALAAAHGRGVAHRDLKPSNIMVSDEGWIKVLDFGLAKLFDPESSEAIDRSVDTLTRRGLAIGTLPYMSPEQVVGDRVDLRTDIFSLGSVLYEMATGERPFSSPSSAGVASAILRDDPRPITSVREDLPPYLETVVRHCLEKSPERRYQSAAEVRSELTDLRREIDSGYISATRSIPAAQPAPAGRWSERLAVWGLRALWLALLPAIVLGGLFGKLVLWGLFRELDVRLIDAARLAQRPLFWAGAFLEQSLDSILAAAAIGWAGALAISVLILNFIALVARPPGVGDDTAPSTMGGERVERHLRRWYHVAILPGLTLAAAWIFADHAGSQLWLTIFVALSFAYLAHLVLQAPDLIRGRLGERFSYLVVAAFYVALLLFIPYNYGRRSFDIDQPPLVEAARRVGAEAEESFERSGEMTIVVAPADRILASIQLSDQGKLVSLLEVESFRPRPQPKSLRHLVQSIEAAEIHDAEAIAGSWLE